MSYLVIARKYRPKEFDEIIGQETTVRALKNSLENDKISQAYLFSGTRGVGKTSIARILARALNCEQGPTITPCNKCSSCTDILSGSSIDIFEIDGASNRRVEETQQIIENVMYAPSRDRYKIYIIDEVHMLSNHAFNALLKTIEEPPAHVIFIMATTEYHKIPQTIRSRTQHFHFANISLTEIVDNLRMVAKEEKIEISDKVLNLIAKEANGSVRDAQSLMEQVISFCGNKVIDEDAQSILGSIGIDILDRFITLIAEGDNSGLIKLANETNAKGYNLIILIRKLIERVRNLMLLTVDKNSLSQVVEASGDDPKDLSKHANLFKINKLLMIFDILIACENRMRFSQYPLFIFESSLIKASTLDTLIPVEKIGTDKFGGSGTGNLSSNGYEDKSIGEKSAPRIKSLTPYSVMSPEEESTLQPLTQKPTNTTSTIDAILKEIARRRKFLHAVLMGAEKFDVKNDKLIISISHKFHKNSRKDIEDNESNKSLIKEVCKKYIGGEGEFVIEEYIPEDLEREAEKETHTKKDQQNRELERIYNEPHVKKLVDIFGGEIVEYNKESKFTNQEE